MNSQSLWQPPPAAADHSIFELSSVVADQIAAGEVVERPASVIKELVENAFDAHATQVDVYIRGGGLEEIRVEDDGFGMGPKDARLCFKRHATSKLRSLDDLLRLHSFGFRGEALSSIASVSTMEISTRCSAQSAGTYVQVVAGEVKDVNDVGRGIGTSMRVKELFFNTPARRKFMRSAATEQAHIIRALQQVALGRPGVGVKLSNEKRTLLDIRAEDSTKERLLTVLGRQVQGFLETQESHEGIDVRIFRSAPLATRKDSKGLWVFLNGRFIRDRMLQKAILDAFPPDSLGGYPIMVVYIDADPANFDINVHPQKVEVRFLEPAKIYHALGLALRQETPVQGDYAPDTQQGVKRALYEAYQGGMSGTTGREIRESGALKSYLGGSRGVSSQSVERESLQDKGALFIGEYVLMPSAEQLSLMNVGEVAREHFLAHMQQALSEPGLLETRRLMLPKMLDLSPAAWQRFAEASELFAQVGLEMREVGPTRIALSALPAYLSEGNSSLISEWLKDFLESAEGPLQASMQLEWLQKLQDFVEIPTSLAGFEHLLMALERLPVLAQQEIFGKAQRYVDLQTLEKLFLSGTPQPKDA